MEKPNYLVISSVAWLLTDAEAAGLSISFRKHAAAQHNDYFMSIDLAVPGLATKVNRSQV